MPSSRFGSVGVSGLGMGGAGRWWGLAVEASVAEGAVHGVELHALFKIRIGGRQRIGDARSMALHGGIDGSHRQAAFHVRRLDVCGRRKETEHSEAKPAEDEYQERNDYTKCEFSHGSSRRAIVADGRGRALVGVAGRA